MGEREHGAEPRRALFEHAGGEEALHGREQTFSDSLLRDPLLQPLFGSGQPEQERSGGYLLAHGAARFARSSVETGLIDEYRLVVHPVVLGAGDGSSPRRSPLSP